MKKYIRLDCLVRKIGYRSYKEYLTSDHWLSVKRRWRHSHKPQYCLVCGSTKYQLHHTTYERIGHEFLDDLVPMCGNCHTAMHDFLKSHNLPLSESLRVIPRLQETITSAASQKVLYTERRILSDEEALRIIWRAVPPDRRAGCPFTDLDQECPTSAFIGAS